MLWRIDFKIAMLLIEIHLHSSRNMTELGRGVRLMKYWAKESFLSLRNEKKLKRVQVGIGMQVLKILQHQAGKVFAWPLVRQ